MSCPADSIVDLGSIPLASSNPFPLDVVRIIVELAATLDPATRVSLRCTSVMISIWVTPIHFEHMHLTYAMASSRLPFPPMISSSVKMLTLHLDSWPSHKVTSIEGDVLGALTQLPFMKAYCHTIFPDHFVSRRISNTHQTTHLIFNGVRFGRRGSKGNLREFPNLTHVLVAGRSLLSAYAFVYLQRTEEENMMRITHDAFRILRPCPSCLKVLIFVEERIDFPAIQSLSPRSLQLIFGQADPRMLLGIEASLLVWPEVQGSSLLLPTWVGVWELAEAIVAQRKSMHYIYS
ncbi:hypothetical protein DL96DRAFT_1631110 [Flagelloscypha sp. PMI_526]|nr:hypothetical protein DL96DRAFT_1631110 [Flagelloscypha sp. PMI_526]